MTGRAAADTVSTQEQMQKLEVATFQSSVLVAVCTEWLLAHSVTGKQSLEMLLLHTTLGVVRMCTAQFGSLLPYTTDGSSHEG